MLISVGHNLFLSADQFVPNLETMRKVYKSTEESKPFHMKWPNNDVKTATVHRWLFSEDKTFLLYFKPDLARAMTARDSLSCLIWLVWISLAYSRGPAWNSIDPQPRPHWQADGMHLKPLWAGGLVNDCGPGPEVVTGSYCEPGLGAVRGSYCEPGPEVVRGSYLEPGPEGEWGSSQLGCTSEPQWVLLCTASRSQYCCPPTHRLTTFNQWPPCVCICVHECIHI